MRSVRVRRSSVLTATALFALAACGGGDDGGSASVEEFCEIVASADELDGEDMTASLAAFDDLLEVAPGEILGDLETLREAFAGVADLDENDPEAFDRMFEVFLDPDVVAAGESLDAFDRANCGGAGAAAAADTLYDPDDDGPIPDDRLSRVGLANHLDQNHADAPWFASINQTGTIGSDRLQVGGTGLSGDDALEICAAILDYAATFPDVAAQAEVLDGRDASLQAQGTADTGCSLVES